MRRAQALLSAVLALTLGAALAGCSPQEAQTMAPFAATLPQTTIPKIDSAAPARVETATFALGWFWGPDSRFGSLPGVVRTRVGYAGGTQDNPTYRNLGDHSETIEIDYDPTQITYEELLDIFWQSHNPASPSYSRQYASILFTHSEEQARLARESKAREESRLGRAVYTEIVPYTRFYLAENYHQKYYLRGVAVLAAEYTAIYPEPDDFVNSTAVARVNGFVGRHGSTEEVRAVLDQLGLSEQGQRKLLQIVGGRW
jgi:methionine-S-sulfoxide reductase